MEGQGLLLVAVDGQVDGLTKLDQPLHWRHALGVNVLGSQNTCALLQPQGCENRLLHEGCWTPVIHRRMRDAPGFRGGHPQVPLQRHGRVPVPVHPGPHLTLFPRHGYPHLPHHRFDGKPPPLPYLQQPLCVHLPPHLGPGLRSSNDPQQARVRLVPPRRVVGRVDLLARRHGGHRPEGRVVFRGRGFCQIKLPRGVRPRGVRGRGEGGGVRDVVRVRLVPRSDERAYADPGQGPVGQALDHLHGLAPHQAVSAQDGAVLQKWHQLQPFGEVLALPGALAGPVHARGLQLLENLPPLLLPHHAHARPHEAPVRVGVASVRQLAYPHLDLVRPRAPEAL
mmetsp:Transcript_4467/g.13215  ORF Transcript_4467/g.13215 Transcript_4467/m.13215 type:complete len:338 (+) Transcript_4467:3171-4184(+)